MTSNAEHPDQFHAAVVEEFNKDLNLKDIDLPEPGPNEALVKVLTSGVCHTDLHAAQGDWPIKPGLPFVPGHEGVDGADRHLTGYPDVPADDVQIPAGLGIDLRGHAQRVGGDDEFAPAAQVPHEGEGRRPAVDEEHVPVRDESGGRQADLLLLVGLEPRAILESRVVPGDRRVGHGAPVGADDDPLGVELVQVAADGVGGDGEVLGEGRDRDLPMPRDVFGDVGLAAGR